MLDLAPTLRDGALLCIIGSAYLLILLRVNPRLFINHYPREIRAAVPPKSDKEQRISILLAGIPLLLLLIGAHFGSALLWLPATYGPTVFWESFAHAFAVIFLFNLVDLLILDWLIVCWLKPAWATIPGTGHIVVPNPYRHHFKGFLLGTLIAVIVSLAIAAMLSMHF